MAKLSNRSKFIVLSTVAICALVVFTGTFTSLAKVLSSKKTYYIADYIDLERCDILGERGEFLATFPLGFCQFLPDRTVIGGLKKPRRIDANGAILWQLDIVPDHHLHVDLTDSTLWIHHYEFERQDGKNVASGVISQFDLDGNLLYRWGVKDHLMELAEKIPDIHLAYRPINGLNLVEYSHTRINSVQIIGKNSNPKGLPYLTPGNLVIGCWETTQIFILDRESSKIVWNISLRNAGIMGPHTPYVDTRGDVVFFINDVDIKNSEDNDAAIGVIDTQSLSITKHTVDLKPWKQKFRSGIQGSVYADGEGYVVAATAKNIAARLNSDMTVDWKSKNIFSKGLPYRVRPVEASLVEPFLKQQL